MKKTPAHLEWEESVKRAISRIKSLLEETGISDEQKEDLREEWSCLANSFVIADTLWDFEEPPQAKPSKVSPRYRVISGDNFHPYDESDVDSTGAYGTYAEALATAKRMIEKSLRWERGQSKKPTDPAELFDRYLNFGDSVSIRPDEEPRFSGIKYAEEAAVWICQEPV